MFGDSNADLISTLGTMQAEALRRCNFNQSEVHGEVAAMVRNDRRFDAYDPDRLVEKAWKVRNSGGRLDLDDPYIRRGGQPRPENRRGIW
jgi:hypothetical protein